ncbi:hypothetical protein [Pectinatus frisingensis]|jgi:hypothetical protein|uniref:hypothetical protein n=1 Tax=Pectinatus frisingensis TaxID=865 RepID=UPI0018C54E4B|nr:hypothetical protein [Pectinatus frisingensis]
MKKAEAEAKFVEEIKPIGIEKYAIVAEGRHEYWEFYLKNGTRRYWKDLSQENADKLGIASDNK